MRTGLTVALGCGLAVAAAVWFLGRDSHEPAPVAAAPSAGERRVEYWYDPMHPEHRFPAPGRSPFMDMELVPKYADAVDSGGVRIDPRMVQNLGIRTAPVAVGNFDRSVRVVGRVEADERSVQRVSVRASGWVEALLVRADGEHVRRGELLARVYSPAFDAAQRDFLLALDSGDAGIVSAARGRLAALAVDPVQIGALERSRQAVRHLDVYSPIDGYVMQLMTREGAAVEPAAALFELASHDPIWVVADVPEAAAGWIGPGAAATVMTTTYPGRTFAGRVDYVYPSLDAASRTRRARVVLANPDDALHPDMYAEVNLVAGELSGVLLVPTEAVIRTGRRSVVIVAQGDGAYRPVAVELGDERAGVTVVRSGLSVGERVVVSGQFLLDSEASLRGVEVRTSPNESAGAQP